MPGRSPGASNEGVSKVTGIALLRSVPVGTFDELVAFATLRSLLRGLLPPSFAGGQPEADGEGGTRTAAIAARRELDPDAGGHRCLHWQMGKVEPAQWRLPCGGSWIRMP